MKKILACIIILDISIFGQFKPDFNEHQNRGRTVDEREEDIFKAWVASVRAHTCDFVRVRAVRKLGVRFTCMRPEKQVATHLWRFLWLERVHWFRVWMWAVFWRFAYFQKLTKVERMMTFLTASYCFSGHRKIITAHSNYCKNRDLNIKLQTITIFILLDLGPHRRSSRSYVVSIDFFTIFFCCVLWLFGNYNLCIVTWRICTWIKNGNWWIVTAWNVCQIGAN